MLLPSKGKTRRGALHGVVEFVVGALGLAGHAGDGSWSFRPHLDHCGDVANLKATSAMDVFSPVKQSEIMRRVRSKDTKPEFFFRPTNVASRPVEFNVIPTQSEAMGRNLALG